MKILQVLNHFLPHQIAGTEVYTWALCKQLMKLGFEVTVLIPNFGSNDSLSYQYDGIDVLKYAEPSKVNRLLILGKKKPEGLKTFQSFVESYQPDIIHFHELGGSNGITYHHVEIAKTIVSKVVMTFHLASYSCRTGNLMYKGKKLCNGKISNTKCTKCYLENKGYSNLIPFLLPISTLCYWLKLDTSSWNMKLGTALSTSFLINKYKRDFRKLVENCDRVVTLTKWYEQILLLNGVPPSKIAFIPQGLPIQHAFENERETKENDSILRLIFLGRISPFKGLDILIEAVSGLQEEKVRLDIFGSSQDDSYEKECREKSRHKQNIKWGGSLPQSQVIQSLRGYDALCLCSTFSEMSPLVIQEAFAAGIPVIASNVYGNAEQVKTNVNGLLFQFKSVKDLQKQLQRCIDEPNLLNKLKKNIQKPRSFEEVAYDYSMLYQAIIEHL